QLSRSFDRPVLWQRNADRSRCRATSTPVAGTGGTGAICGRGRLRWGLGIRPFHTSLRRPKRALSRRVDVTGRPGVGDLAYPPRRPRLGHHLPTPVHPGRRSNHGRPSFEWSAGDWHGRRLVPARARGVGRPFSAYQGAGRAVGGGRSGDEVADDERPGELQGPPLSAGPRQLPPAPVAAAAPADLDWRRWRTANAADRRPPGRRLACLWLR